VQELVNSSELYYANVIKDYQQSVTDTIDEILSINGWSDFKSKITNTQPIKFTFSENMLSQILDKNELREMISYPPLAPEQQTNTNNPNMTGAGHTDPNQTNQIPT
jgi:hypothetical protein